MGKVTSNEKIYIRAWKAEGVNTVCWQYTHRRDYQRNRVSYWTFGKYVIFTTHWAPKIDSHGAHVIIEAIRTGNSIIHRVNLDYWKGEKSWKPKNRKW